jgi:hypothetical protein
VPSQLCCSKECSKENNRRLNNKHKKKDTKAEKPKDIPYRERPNVCDSFCDGCIYKGIVEANLRCCNFIFVADKIRPCPSGNGCTVKKTVTKEEREEARAKRHREWMEKKKAQRMRTVICAYCGREFQTSDSRKKYCRPDCSRRGRQEAWREREERRKKERQ